MINFMMFISLLSFFPQISQFTYVATFKSKTLCHKSIEVMFMNNKAAFFSFFLVFFWFESNSAAFSTCLYKFTPKVSISFSLSWF